MLNERKYSETVTGAILQVSAVMPTRMVGRQDMSGSSSRPEPSGPALANANQWAASVPVPGYAIDDQTAIKVTDGTVEVVSEGHWKLFTP
jgi:hypothetical protein